MQRDGREMSSDEKIAQLPDGFQQLLTQVAGHSFEPSNASAIGLLQDAAAGCVLKPLGKPECGIRELQFYESLNKAVVNVVSATHCVDNDDHKCNDSPAANELLLFQLAPHVPKYYGKSQLVVNQREHTFVKLEDLTCGMCRPCVMDVKIGKRTWDPQASAQKRQLEEQKYVNTKQKLGLCLPGFQVYLPSNRSATDEPILTRHSKDYGKSLTVASFTKTIALFFNVTSDSNKREHRLATDILLGEVLRQLLSIQAWFKRQRLMHFYASSLLISYDFEKLQQISRIQKLNGHNSSINPSQWIRVRMIDFAHVYPAENGELDHNYLNGITSLIDVVQTTLNR